MINLLAYYIIAINYFRKLIKDIKEITYLDYYNEVDSFWSLRRPRDAVFTSQESDQGPKDESERIEHLAFGDTLQDILV